ncbi:beta-lactamase family protein [Allokutzneria sp. A3M-2-11 16]|uniref:serine hydrolase domain-containing protein n=1 Tax=Allokutzneria sp. A3M-2-11 16 TaxID=2962043 RepID=UPI0020B68457|nr:serine hydrolase domain-containing protein [Allokutzneria sp. A3M-2-11 16]MCP3799205.1 beta-lactamase family protein [Allokutzneria sp. A3M-2-11 16]
MMARKTGKRLAALALAATAVLGAPGVAQAGQAETQALLNRYLTHAGPGAAVLAGNASTSWSVHSGTAVVNANRPIQPADRFRIASQTKTFTAAVVLQLVDEGKVALDTAIERYLPGVVTGNGHDGNRITVRQLLQHTSGIPENQSAPKPKPGPGGTYPLRELVRDGLSRPAVVPPGTRFEYSNTNFQIAGMLIEKITGQQAGDAITDRVIRRLGLTGTKVPKAGDRQLGTPYVRGYAGGRVGSAFLWIENTTGLEPSFLGAAGDVVSTQTDMITFARALTDGKLVSPAALAEMRKTVSGSDASFGYGLGLQRLTLSCGGYAWGHAGDTMGYSSVTMATDDGRHATLVTNTIVLNTTAPTRFAVIDSALC